MKVLTNMYKKLFTKVTYFSFNRLLLQQTHTKAQG